MKKIISVLLSLITILSILSINVFAQENITELEYSIDEETIEDVYGIYDAQNAEISMLSTGLITSKSLKLSKTSSNLIITAKTFCSSGVTKCGFTYVKLQRSINGSWTDYTTYCYYDQYSESTSKTFSKTISPPKGYTYRVICEHYAEKPRLIIFKDTETSYNVTSSLSY